MARRQKHKKDAVYPKHGIDTDARGQRSYSRARVAERTGAKRGSRIEVVSVAGADQNTIPLGTDKLPYPPPPGIEPTRQCRGNAEEIESRESRKGGGTTKGETAQACGKRERERDPADPREEQPIDREQEDLRGPIERVRGRDATVARLLHATDLQIRLPTHAPLDRQDLQETDLTIGGGMQTENAD
ncbi:unnamed protein product [Boreogadus saida]